MVDERECIDGEPRRMYSRRYVDRRVLASQFPKHREVIMAAKCEAPLSLGDWGYDPLEDQLLVVEAWSLPTRTDAEDGRYLCMLGRDVL